MRKLFALGLISLAVGCSESGPGTVTTPPAGAPAADGPAADNRGNAADTAMPTTETGLSDQ